MAWTVTMLLVGPSTENDLMPAAGVQQHSASPVHEHTKGHTVANAPSRGLRRHLLRAARATGRRGSALCALQPLAWQGMR